MGGVRSRRVATKPTLIFNSTPLIYLAKAKLTEKLHHLPFHLSTTQAVYDEVVVKGVERQVEEAEDLKRLFESHVVEVVKEVDEGIVKKLGGSGIHHGEATVISLAYEMNATAIIDDRRARHVAETVGIRLSSTPHIIVQLIKRGVITKQEGKQAIDKIIKEGWHCGAKAYSEIIRAIEKA